MIDSHLNLDPDDLATQMAIGNPPTKKKCIRGKEAFFSWAKSRVQLTLTLLRLSNTGRSPPLGSSPRPIYHTKDGVIPKGRTTREASHADMHTLKRFIRGEGTPTCPEFTD